MVVEPYNIHMQQGCRKLFLHRIVLELEWSRHRSKIVRNRTNGTERWRSRRKRDIKRHHRLQIHRPRRPGQPSLLTWGGCCYPLNGSKRGESKRFWLEREREGVEEEKGKMASRETRGGEEAQLAVEVLDGGIIRPACKKGGWSTVPFIIGNTTHRCLHPLNRVQFGNLVHAFSGNLRLSVGMLHIQSYSSRIIPFSLNKLAHPETECIKWVFEKVGSKDTLSLSQLL